MGLDLYFKAVASNQEVVSPIINIRSRALYNSLCDYFYAKGTEVNNGEDLAIPKIDWYFPKLRQSLKNALYKEAYSAVCEHKNAEALASACVDEFLMELERNDFSTILYKVTY